MNRADAARVLTKAAAFDQRTIGDADVLAWHEALHEVDATDALEAVTRHYRESKDRIWPADVRRIAEDIWRERRRAANHRAALEAEDRAAVDRGPVKDRSAEVTAVVRQVVESLPGTASDRIHERARLVARRDKGRPDTGRSRGRKGNTRPARDWPDPTDDWIAALATRYLLDGHDPKAVADRLAVSRRWCHQTAARLRRPASSEQETTRG